jgi:hypothetical protein
MILTRQKGSNKKGDCKVDGNKVNKRNPSSRLASQPGFSIEKEHGRVAHVRQLHRS